MLSFPRPAALIPALILIVAPLCGAQAADDPQTVLERFLLITGADPNAALTSFRSLLIPMGGMSEGMSMAATAVAADGSALEINPASTSVLDQSELSVYYNDWTEEAQFDALLYASRSDRLGYATAGKILSLGFTEYNDFGSRVAKGYYAEFTALANISYNFFQSFYFYGLSLGVNLKAAYSSFPDFADLEGVVQPGSGLSQNGFAVMADIGLLTRFNFLKYFSSRGKNFSIGLVARNLGPAAFSQTVSGTEALPSSVAAGIAYSPIRPLVLSLDFVQPVNLLDASVSEAWSLGFGLSARVTDWLSMQAGFLAKQGKPRITLGSAISLDDLDLIINYTFDRTSQTAVPLDRISVQLKLNLGDGGRAALAKKVEDLYLSGLEAYARGDIQDAVAMWTEALKLDPGFEPARESMAVAKKALDLQQQMEALRRLE